MNLQEVWIQNRRIVGIRHHQHTDNSRSCSKDRLGSMCWATRRSPAPPARRRGAYCSSVMKATSVQPWPISSMVRPPQPTHADGSGLWRLLAVLSCPRDVVQDGPLRKQVRLLVRIDDLPRLLVVGDVRQHLRGRPSRWIASSRHPLAAEVHVRLEAENQRRLRERKEALVADDAVRRDAQQRDPVQRVVVDQRAGGIRSACRSRS